MVRNGMLPARYRYGHVRYVITDMDSQHYA